MTAPTPAKDKMTELHSLLRCLACSGNLSLDGNDLVCDDCASHVAWTGGYFDFLTSSAEKADDGDSSSQRALTVVPKPSTRAQKLMENPKFVRKYEGSMRPRFARIFSGRRVTATPEGEFYLYRNSLAVDYQDGPWLDLSCGTGYFTSSLARSVPDATVIGFDLSPAMLDGACRRSEGLSNVHYVRGDVHKIPLRDASCNGVLNVGALHLYDSPDTVFDEIIRVLRPGGAYVCSDFTTSRSPLANLAAWLSQIKLFDPANFPAWLERHGFVDYTQVIFGNAFVFKARKPNGS